MSVSFSVRIDKDMTFSLFEGMLILEIDKNTVGYIHCNYATEAQLNEVISYLTVVRNMRFPSVQPSEPVKETKQESNGRDGDESRVHGLSEDSSEGLQSTSSNPRATGVITNIEEIDGRSISEQIQTALEEAPVTSTTDLSARHGEYEESPYSYDNEDVQEDKILTDDDIPF